MNSMNWLVNSPEILLLVMACVVALVDLFVTHPQRRPTFWLAQLSLAAVAWLHLQNRAARAVACVTALRWYGRRTTRSASTIAVLAAR